MIASRDRTLRDQAAKSVLQRIRVDRDRVSSRLRPLIDTVVKRLFDLDFNVAALWRDHGIADKSAATRFQELGITPSVYIAVSRIETAAHLLENSTLPLWRVGQAVGYASERTFGRAFKQWIGQPPAAYRRNPTPRSAWACQAELQAAPESDFRDAAEEREIVERLEGIVRGLRGRRESATTSLPRLMTGWEFERAQAERLVWPRLQELSFVEQHRFVEQCRPFSTSALFELLHEMSRELGRHDRPRGIELSTLAVLSLSANEESLGELVLKLRPQGWAWLGNARRLALDFRGADEACRRSVAELRATTDPFTAGIVYVCQGSLRKFQSRFDEAAELLDASVTAFHEAEQHFWEISSLLNRASVSVHAERHDEAMASLAQAAAMVEEKDGPLAYRIAYARLAAMVWSERFQEAEAFLATMKAVFRDPRQEIRHWQMRWAEANIDHGFGRMQRAEGKFLATQAGLEALGETLSLALLHLDLAVFYVDLGQTEKVVENCRVVLPVFNAMQLHEKSVLSLRLLSEALQESQVTAEILRDLRSTFRRDPLVAQRDRR